MNLKWLGRFSLSLGGFVAPGEFLGVPRWGMLPPHPPPIVLLTC